MRILGKIILESIRQALQQLNGNRLRSFLSLLGISIGIFCIIGVLSAVDSLEDNIRGSMEKLGNDVIYVQKWPWADVSGSWWDYIKRPYPVYDEYVRVRDNVQSADMAAFFIGIGSRTLKWEGNSSENSYLLAGSIEMANIFQFEFSRGRFFSPQEYNYGSNKMVLGFDAAQALFGTVEPIGKRVKMQGRKYEVIGVLESSGDELINPVDFDEAIIVSYPNAQNLANLKGGKVRDGSIVVKAASGVPLQQLRDEVRVEVRGDRRLPPRAEDDFALNELSLVNEVFDSFFGVLNGIGIIIGMFSMLVGGVSVANIMFVSVRERTSLIGVKKALGAKRYIILLEFLIEAIILCIIGGLVGLLLVAIITQVISNAIDFEIYLDLGNVIIGLLISIAIGVLSGVIPALLAARMDPVEAMRQ